MANEANEYPSAHDFSRTSSEAISLMHALALDIDARVHPEIYGEERTVGNQDQRSTGTTVTDEIVESLFRLAERLDDYNANYTITVAPPTQ